MYFVSEGEMRRLILKLHRVTYTVLLVSSSSMFVLFHPDGIISADGAINPEFYTDFQNGGLGQTGHVSRYGAVSLVVILA